ncbi:DUF997 family protein [Aeromonas caviae]|uniref:DUF997 family protein n=1 Tax=Aeromonas caviae TaxID=648 RepID=UPI003EC729A7
MVVVCLETASLPAPCLSTSTSPRSREEPYFIPEDLELWDLPLWFLLSCILMPLLFIGLCALMVYRLFVDIPLDSEVPPHES